MIFFWIFKFLYSQISKKMLWLNCTLPVRFWLCSEWLYWTGGLDSNTKMKLSTGKLLLAPGSILHNVTVKRQHFGGGGGVGRGSSPHYLLFRNCKFFFINLILLCGVKKYWMLLQLVPSLKVLCSLLIDIISLKIIVLNQWACCWSLFWVDRLA